MANAEQQYLEYLKKTRLLVLDTNLAKAIGEKQAIILQQINFWVQHNKEKETNFIDGRYWCYNSLQEWQKENFEHMTLKTVERCLEDLRKNEVVIARREVRNGKSTLFYSIDYDVMVDLLTGKREWMKRDKSSKCRKDKEGENRQNVDSIDHKNEQNDKMSMDESTKCRKVNGQNVEEQNDKMSKPYNIYNIYNNSSTDNTTENTSENTTEIIRREEEKKIEEKVGTNVPTQKKVGQADQYIILPDTEESKPCESNRKRKYELYDMFDNCRIKAVRKYNLCDSDAKYVSKIIEHFCTKYHEKTKMFHGVVKGECLDKILEFTIGELIQSVDVIKEMDKFLEEMQNESGRCQITDFVNRRMAS